VILAHSIALDPTPRQAAYFSRAAGVARFSYNNALTAWNRAYEAERKVNPGKLRREFNAARRERFPWMDEVSSYAYDYPWIQLRKAFQAFFRKKAKYPKFRTKRRSPESFYVHNREMEFDGRTLRLGPKRLDIGPVRMREELRLNGKVMGATVRRDAAGGWFLSVQVDVGDYRKDRTADGDVGVDLGVLKLATFSTGEMIDGLKPLARALDKLRRLSRQHSRKKKGSRNREKSRLRLVRLHRRVRNVRGDFLHRLTTRLCRENQTVAVEDLSVRGMMRNRGLARPIADMGWGEFRRQLEYKCPIYGTCLKIAPRFFPSSKTCSCCGAIRDELPLGERTFRCGCGIELDRDLNAALNLLDLLFESAVPANGGKPSPGEARADTPAEREALAVASTVKPLPQRSRNPMGTLEERHLQIGRYLRNRLLVDPTAIAAHGG
jgi:putative transposase